jgi:Flp pilus assembly protein TadG
MTAHLRRVLASRLAAAARFAANRRAAVSVEFAVAGTLMIAVTLGLVGAGLLSWTRSGLQAAASATARCVALGSPACATPTSYAVTLAGQWVFPGIIAAGDVTVSQATSCNGAAGQYTRVTISGTHWLGSVLPAGQDTITVSVTACHLSGS